MKLLLFTDNHFSQYSSIIRSRGEKYSLRLENQIKSLNWVNKIAEEEQCDFIVCLGDFFDKPELNAEEITALKEIKWCNKPKYFIVGNHETNSHDLTFNSLNALTSIGKIIDKPTMINGFGFNLYMLPYISETDRKPLSDYINQLNLETAGMLTTQEVKQLLILSHNDISGIRYGQYESKNGFNIDEITDNCDLYINGHLHNQTQVSDKIFNLGNLTGQNFSEDGFKYSHCIGILDTYSMKLDLINNPFAFNFYKIEVNNIQELKNQIEKLDKEYSIGTIKIPEQYIDEARIICNEHFKEYRLLMIPNIKTQIDNIDDNNSNIDHIQKFKNYCLENIGSSDILMQELDLL